MLSATIRNTAAILALLGLSHAPTARAAGYDQTNLVSDGSVNAHTIDKNLSNPWGVSFAPGGDFWISDNNTGLSTLYDGQGATSPLVVTVPGPGGAVGAPSGQVFNPTSGFVVSENGVSGPALFVFVNEDGVISGWNPTVDFKHAIPVADNSQPGLANAVYKGAALATVHGQTYLYVTDFGNARITVFDSNWKNVTAQFPFADPTIRKGFAPFNIAQIGNYLYVTYALQDAAKHDDVRGTGHGYIDAYGLNGRLNRRFATQGHLDSPWGLALAPNSGFGAFSGRLLVGNFGDGEISAFNIATGAYLGALTDPAGAPIKIGSLWDITFGEGAKNAESGALYFTSGLKAESGGLFGALTTHH
jgi:uncharacterized protein (TIGR03118 family)